MQHADFRRLFGADPKRAEPEVLAHRAACAECAAYAASLEKLDGLLVPAMKLAPPRAAPPPWEVEAARSSARAPAWRLALAASILLTVALAASAVFWTGKQRGALIAEVVKHADRERDVLIASEKRVAQEKVEKTLAKAGARLLRNLPVSVARTCKIHGVIAPHLVMQTGRGPVAVLLLSDERLFMSHSFEEAGYEGRLVRQGRHSLAVVGTSEAAVDEGARLAGDAIDWAE